MHIYRFIFWLHTSKVELIKNTKMISYFLQHNKNELFDYQPYMGEKGGCLFLNCN